MTDSESVYHENEIMATPMTEMIDPANDFLVICSPLILLIMSAKSGDVEKSVYEISGLVYTRDICCSQMQMIVLTSILRMRKKFCF